MECERASQAGADLAGVAESKAAPQSVRQAGADMVESISKEALTYLAVIS